MKVKYISSPSTKTTFSYVHSFYMWNYWGFIRFEQVELLSKN